MSPRHVVVDGSNIATEGRSLPSLAQLDSAVREFQQEHKDAEITVVVDATFGHRIDESERATFEEAEAHGEVVSPPAGAIGRGDAFLLLIAERTGATVLSNDSFQEFHGEHEWLFEKDRLIGGKPVPGVGWIFTPRTPVRGPKSREAVKEARRHRVRIGSKEASRPMPVPKVPPPRPAKEPAGAGGDGGVSAGGPEAPRAATARGGQAAEARVRKAIAAATKEVEAPDSTSARRRRRRRGAGPPPQAVNEPLEFITFIAEHPLGKELEGEVDSFTSHGAFVTVGGAKGYVPLSGLGDPPPTRARAVLSRGERRTFVLQALDPQRRGIELALPAYAHVAGSPSEETVEAEIAVNTKEERPRGRARKAGAVTAEAAPSGEAATGTGEAVAAGEPAPAGGEAGAPVPGEAAAPRARRARKGAAPAGEVERGPEVAPEPGDGRPEGTAEAERAAPARPGRAAAKARGAAKATAGKETARPAKAKAPVAKAKPAPAKAAPAKAAGGRAAPSKAAGAKAAGAAKAKAAPPSTGEPEAEAAPPTEGGARKATSRKRVASTAKSASPAKSQPAKSAGKTGKAVKSTAKAAGSAGKTAANHEAEGTTGADSQAPAKRTRRASKKGG